MECRSGCGACCIAPSITQPFYRMPEGKKANERCVHLDDQQRCRIFNDPRRPLCCAQFQPEESICLDNAAQALAELIRWEESTA